MTSSVGNAGPSNSSLGGLAVLAVTAWSPNQAAYDQAQRSKGDRRLR